MPEKFYKIYEMAWLILLPFVPSSDDKRSEMVKDYKWRNLQIVLIYELSHILVHFFRGLFGAEKW